MEAFILAAGVSRRLYPHTYDIPKCLLEVGSKPIIHYQLEALDKLSVSNVTMIVGYQREMLMKHVTNNFPSLNFNFIINNHFFETNTAFSAFLACEKLILDDHILMNADVVYEEKMLFELVQSSYSSVLAVDIKECGREEVKVVDGGDNKISAIGKDLIESQCLGEFIGVAKLSKNFNRFFSNSLKKLIDAGGKNDYFEAAIQPILGKIDLNYLDVSSYSCMEIDFIEDLDQARGIFKSN
tara:strand:- start:944 stop:1663 length:720 start_codon:yes stop_codon:yes gene_type:complete